MLRTGLVDVLLSLRVLDAYLGRLLRIWASEVLDNHAENYAKNLADNVAENHSNQAENA
jgi:cytochrome c-type biogenesis protein CcmE